ncbi:MAG: hypothetical protein BroJett018_51550 [Chloroflexota bacterium]|nr:DUF4260 family protein [Chloroflexota bacterium]NOG66014.1 DUF4260 domain-containing protein [Chloroflexota bacterium]GIK67361.1 MAG: hypothetical protein BroJett018_51550 [Chloroflexota bacterium]
MSSQAASIAANPAISQPRLLLHLEGLAIFIGAVALYWTEGFSGWLFALLLFAPDLSMVGYLKNPQIGATVYNAIHTFVTAGILLGMGWSLEIDLLLQLGLILAAHIGIDRTLGYGLKYATAFKETHLQRV